MTQQHNRQPDLLAEIAMFRNEPLAIRPGYMESILSQPLDAAAVEKIEAEALRYVGTHAFSNWHIADGVAVIPIVGALAKRSMFRWTYDDIGVSIQQALDDSKVHSILLNVDSPGGAAAGFFDLTDLIFEARGQKPIHAIVNESAYSAAYGIASAADVLWLPRTAGLGSVGVMAVHVDGSKWNEQHGYTVTPIFAGDKKIDGHPDFPLSASANADIQDEIDRLHELFLATVARNRGMTIDAVRETQAGVYHGENAIQVGFADLLGTFDDAMSTLIAGAPAPTGFSVAGMASALGISEEQLQSDLESAGFQAIETAHEDAQTQEADDMAKETDPKKNAEAEAEAARIAKEAEASAENEAGAEVIDINGARAEGRTEADAEFKARASQINVMCALDGCADRAGEFIEDGTSIEDVGKALLKERAENAGEEIDGHAKPGVEGSETEIPTIDIDAVYDKWNGSAVA